MKKLAVAAAALLAILALALPPALGMVTDFRLPDVPEEV